MYWDPLETSFEWIGISHGERRSEAAGTVHAHGFHEWSASPVESDVRIVQTWMSDWLAAVPTPVAVVRLGNTPEEDAVATNLRSRRIGG